MTTEFEQSEAAQTLSRQILALARRHDHRALLEIDADPQTADLLDFLDDDLSRAAAVHLQGARTWRRRREEANQRRLTEARAALDGFDLARARSLLLRVEDEYLSTHDAADRDDILLALEARSMETEQLQQTADQILDEHLPFWRRWFRKGG
jgi:hypothetical protein